MTMDRDEYDVDSPPVIEFPSIPGPPEYPSDGETAEDQLLEEKEDSGWIALPLQERWKTVVKHLIKKELRWDDTSEPDEGWNPEVRSLDPKVRKSLTEFNESDPAFPTVLHGLAVNFSNGDFNMLPDATKVKVVEYLIQEHLRARADADADMPEGTVLTRAFTNQNADFIPFVIKKFPHHLADLVSDQDRNTSANCLHYVFKKHLPEVVDVGTRSTLPRNTPRPSRKITLGVGPTLHYVGFLIRSVRDRPQCIVARDGDGNTPMHYAMAYRVCRMPVPQYKKLALQIIEVGDKSKERSSQFNSAQESPYLYFERTKREFMEQNARLRGQKPTKSAAPSMARLSGRKDVSKPREPEDATAQPNVASDEPGSITSHATMKKATMRKPTRDAEEAANPPRSSSPALEISRSAKMGMPNSGRAAISSRAILAVESPAHGKQTGLEPASKPTKNRVDDVKEEKIGNRNVDEPTKSAETLRQHLKLHYIRRKSDLEAKELLYGRVASDKNLYFDATDVKEKTSEKISGLVSMLARPGGFEDTLSYVSLPVFADAADISNSSSKPTSTSYDANEGRQRGARDQDENTLGRSSAVAVLDKLAEYGVRKIITLIVDEDPNSSPHTDSAIERAVRGQDSLVADNRRKHPAIAVEIWDWKKFDLSTDVIRFASPKVSEVNLYWKGNHTVLKGWANKDGIPRLFNDSEKSLKTVIIHWSPGFETVRRCESLLADLKRQVEKHISEIVGKESEQRLTIYDERLKPGRTPDGRAASHLGAPMPGILRAPPDHGWIESMRMFRLALMKLHEELPSNQKPERVKVALIDDGVDRANLNLYGDRAEVRGMSYWTPLMGNFFQNPSWHQSTHGHGTIMANSILRINPWVSLYTMRIQDNVNIGPRNDVNVYIHAGSAARAIEDAIILDVDIISISWTIHDLADSDTKRSQGDGIEALKAAINKAKKKGILIFCSASDDIKKRGADTLPYNQGKGYIFRIGAADAYGWSDKATEDHHTIDYFLPGNQVADDVNPRLLLIEELKPEYRDGSSVATALAAGLASLVLYLVNFMKIYHTGNAQNVNKMCRYGEDLRTRDGLKRAFENMIIDENYRGRKFLPVWILFGSRAEQVLDKTKEISKKWEALDELCTKLAT